MQPGERSLHRHSGAAPDFASTEIDLAFLQDFLGNEDLDLNESLIPPDDLLSPNDYNPSPTAATLPADFALTDPATVPFQQNFQRLDSQGQPQQVAADRQLQPLQTAGSIDETRGRRSQGERCGKQYRSGRQQELNKAAQVRYRQRKKSRAEELRATVAALTEKIQELGTQQQEHAELHARHEQLQHALRLHEQESPSLARDLSLEAGSESAQDRGSARPEEDPHDAECNDDDTSEQRQDRLHDVVQLLRQGIESSWGGEGPIQAAGQQVAYGRLLQEAVDLFVTSGSPTGLDRAGAARCEEPAAASSLDSSWIGAQASLRLTEHMLKEEAMGVKKRAVRKRALSMLQQAQVSIDASTQSDFFTRARARSDLATIVRELRAVLREEAKFREDAARALLQQILVPAQAAALLVAVYPAACDVTMLWEVLLKAPCQ